MITPPCAVISAQSPWPRRPGSARNRRRGTCAPSGSFQKPTGIDGNGLVQTSSPLAAAQRLAVLVEHLDRHAEPAAPGSRRATPARSGCRSTKQRDDVGAAGDRGEVQMSCFTCCVDVVEALGDQRRAGREHRAQRSRACASVDRPTPAFAHGVDVLRRGAEEGHASPRRRSRTARCRRDGTASRRRAAASRSAPAPTTSQFHIIQPQVVK